MLTIFAGPGDGGQAEAARRWPRARVQGSRDLPLGVANPAPFYGRAVWRSLVDARPAVLVGGWQDPATPVDVARRRMLDRLALGARGVLVLFLPPFDVLAEKTSDLAALRCVYDGYLRYLTGEARTDLPLVVHDRTRRGTGPGLRARIETARPRANGGPGIGDFARGATLLVGEQPNARRVSRSLPFVDLRSRGGCSVWLAEQLAAETIPERGLYWINAKEVDGSWTDPAFLGALVPDRVVALGKVARRWCAEVAGVVGYQEVPHPQHWKRRRRRERYPLLDVLARHREP